MPSLLESCRAEQDHWVGDWPPASEQNLGQFAADLVQLDPTRGAQLIAEQGECRGDTTPELFFPEGPGGNYKVAKRICGNCTVRRTCLIVALRRHEPHGIWGGLAPRTRRALVARLNCLTSVRAVAS